MIYFRDSLFHNFILTPKELHHMHTRCIFVCVSRKIKLVSNFERNIFFFSTNLIINISFSLNYKIYLAHYFDNVKYYLISYIIRKYLLIHAKDRFARRKNIAILI